ncbi:hypothetical protein PAE9249_05131 [Paenibacillus sp. CECT 9249]|uniref:hypothetical protein n=1 Tax=Paenibacillus sp. CECT 9249 TaxID=2845385 RepID=UPI001E4DCABD|nr:hypothetical protein [Paenibacillus sp. CECT 9249]CAH0122559.1 hypothetical protein PAE9249_05131 [Paenibacillus sp. CECT 9249]
MAGVAYDGSTIAQSTKNGYVTYDIYSWEPRYCANRDEDGDCTEWRGGYWYYSGSSSTGAHIRQTTIQSSSNVFVNGKSITTVGDSIYMSWEASPPVPSNSSSREYRNVKPGHSGSTTGTVSVGNSSNVFANGKSVAQIGSTVTTGIGTSPTLTTGSSNVFIG